MMKTYEEWWIFRPESTLNTYLKENNYVMNLYFTPEELVQRVTRMMEKNGTYDHGNSEIIFLNKDLQKIFHTESVFKPNLYSLLLDHVDLATVEKVNELRNYNISSEFYINSPVELIYNDPSSLFWIHPLVNTHIYQNRKIVYTWKELQSTFLKFISTPNPHFISSSYNVYTIDPKSILTNLFNFRQFHSSQVFHILQQVTKFLGKSNTIFTLCKQLKFINIPVKNNISAILENVILSNNDLTPYISNSIFI
jgi:hypothetical protein